MDWLSWGGILDFLLEIVSVIPKTVYYLSVAAMSLMDIVQLLLRKVAGLDAHYIGDSSEPITGDIALSFIKSIFDKNTTFPAIRNAFWALVILGLILLIVTTIIAIIRQEYMPGDEESKERPSNNKIFIISRSLKSLFLFLIVPVSAIFGLMLSDVFLVALDSATTSSEVGGALLTNSQITQNLLPMDIQGTNGKVTATYEYMDIFGFGDFPTTTVTFSGMVFKSGAYIANRVRINDTYAVDESTKKDYYNLIKDGDISNFEIFNKVSTDNPAEMAQLIDEAFAANVKLRTPAALEREGVAANFKSKLIYGQDGQVSHFSKFNVGLVWYYYNLWQYNFLVAFAFIVICLKLLVKIIMGLMRRIIELVALFIISPPIVAIMPLDGGKAFGEWRKNFIQKALAAYGSIIGMNLFFLILPYINEIKFFSAEAMGLTFWNASSAIGMINLIISTVFMIAGLVTVEGFIELLSGIIGSESAAKTGGEMVGKVGDTIAKSAKYTGAAAGLATKLVTAPAAIPFKLAGGDKALAKAGNKIKQGVKRGIAFGGKKGQKARSEIAKKWHKEGAQKSYNSMLDKNESYNDSMNDAFKNRTTGQSMSYDDWREKTEEGKNASSDAINRFNSTAKPKDQIQSFAEFRKGRKIGEDGRSSASDAFSTYQKQEMDSQAQTFNDAFTIRREAVARTASPAGQFFNTVGGALGKEMLQVGKHANAFASNFQPLFNEAFERANKQGMKSMIMAFQGKTAKEIELSEIQTRIRDEEAMKAEVNEEERRKAEKKRLAEESKNEADRKKIKEHDKDIKDLKKQNKK